MSCPRDFGPGEAATCSECAEKLSIAAQEAYSSSISDDEAAAIRDLDQAQWQTGPSRPVGPAKAPGRANPNASTLPRAKAITLGQKAVTPAASCSISQRTVTERRPRPAAPATTTAFHQLPAPSPAPGRPIAFPRQLHRCNKNCWRRRQSQLPHRSMPVTDGLQRLTQPRPVGPPTNHPSPGQARSSGRDQAPGAGRQSPRLPFSPSPKPATSPRPLPSGQPHRHPPPLRATAGRRHARPAVPVAANPADRRPQSGLTEPPPAAGGFRLQPGLDSASGPAGAPQRAPSPVRQVSPRSPLRAWSQADSPPRIAASPQKQSQPVPPAAAGAPVRPGRQWPQGNAQARVSLRASLSKLNRPPAVANPCRLHPAAGQRE